VGPPSTSAEDTTLSGVASLVLPSDDELARYTTRELLKRYPNFNSVQIRNARQRRGVRMDATAQSHASEERANSLAAPSVEYDEPIPDRMTWEAFGELFDAIAAVKETEKKYDPRRHRIGVKIKDDQPVGIVFTGDHQLGSEGVDYALWRSDMDLMWNYHQEHGGLFAVGLGDYGSHLGILDHGGSQNRDIVKSGDQYVMLQQFFKLTAGLWLVLLQGCHDTFVSKKGAIDTVERYCELSGARHAWHGAQVDITVGKEKYVTRLRHKYRYNSTLNESNSQRRQAEMEGPADIIAHGHRHTSFTHEGVAAGQDTLMLRSGSYQIHDDFARQQVGNVKADPRQPMAILWPDRHEIWSCRDFKKGLDFLSSLRT
jgi:hypothetical protein